MTCQQFRLTMFLIAAMIVAALSCSQALAQTPGAYIDAKNAEQDAAIETVTAEIEALTAETRAMRETIGAQPGIDAAQNAALSERTSVDAVIGAEIIDIKTRLDALESTTPPDPPVDPPVDPDPEPEPPAVPVFELYLVNADGSKGAAITGAVTVAGAFNICTNSGNGPVQFLREGVLIQTENQPAFCMLGGNEAPFDVGRWPVGTYSIEVRAAGMTPALIALTVREASAPPPVEPPVNDARDWSIQVASWYPSTSNPEQTFANIIRASASYWSGGGMTIRALMDGGFVDRKTGLPHHLPGGWLTSGVYFTGNDDDVKNSWDGEWALEWCGDADLHLEFLAKEFQRKVSANRIEFTRDRVGGKTPWHAAVAVTRMAEPLSCLRIFRIEDEARLRAGKIYSTRFVEAMQGYDKFRDMDMVSANQSVVRSIDDLATMAAAHWGNTLWQAEYRTPYDFQSIPLQAVFAAAIETDTALWHQAPISLGAPQPFYDFETLVFVPNTDPAKPGSMQPVWDQWAGKYRAMARANAATIIDSPEWDRYADAFVAAMIESGYPVERPLYTSLANEVWNFSGQYFMTTNYAWGIGEGLQYNSHEPLRVGYGALMARWKLALDGALARAGRAQPVVYVVEGQAFFPARTMFALSGAKAYMEAKGEAWAAHAPDFGVSVASYWSATWEAFLSAEAWPAAIASDPDGTGERFADFIINDPAIFGLKSVLDYLGQNDRESAKFGVRLIGAYEGGSHLERPGYVSKEWYAAFHWGEQGGRVNTAVNRAIVKAFPGFILSNYILAGPIGGQPWFDCLYGMTNPLCDSWGEFKRAAGQ